MNEQPPGATPHRATAAVNTLRWMLCVACIALVIVAVLLPPEVLAWLRRGYPHFIGLSLRWLDHASSRFDLTHVVLFAGAGLLVACLWPRVPCWRLALAMLALAVGSELLQFCTPGREPRVSDAYDDLLGAALGLALALPFRCLIRR